MDAIGNLTGGVAHDDDVAPLSEEARQPVARPLARPVLKDREIERREAEQLAPYINYEALALPVELVPPQVAVGVDKPRLALRPGTAKLDRDLRRPARSRFI